MKRETKACADYAERISLLASGALTECERAAIEEHLASCHSCRSYFAELRKIAGALTKWRDDFSRVEPSVVARRRWRKEIETATSPLLSHSTKPAFGDWWSQLIWPCRYAWAGMAALWIVLLAVNLRISAGGPQRMTNRDPSISGMAESIAEQRQLLTELVPAAAEPSHNSPPSENSKPRSERQIVWKIT